MGSFYESCTAAMMTVLAVDKLSLADLQAQVQLQSRDFGDYDWLKAEDVVLSERDQLQLQLLQERLLTTRT
jgi:hypothetical protein